MPYVGGTLAPLFDQTPVKAAVVEMADKGGDRMVELTVQNTPIDLSGTGGGGNLRTSWYQRRLRRVRRAPWSGWESGVATDSDHGPDVEHGTGLWGPEHRPYLIEPIPPNRFLHWRDPHTGEDVFARRVMHPGSPGQHMVQIAASVLEYEVAHGLLFDSILSEWVRVQESLA